MSDENKNIENNQEENLNKQEGNKSWWKSCWVKTKPKGYSYSRFKLRNIFYILILIITIFIIINVVPFFRDTYYFELNKIKTVKIIRNKTLLRDKISCKCKEVKTNNKYNRPNIIKLNNEKLLIFEGKRIELYDPKRKKFKKIKHITDNLGDLFYQKDNGNILFIKDSDVIEFDNQFEQFRKISTGILDLNTNYYKSVIIPYSNEVIYIGLISLRLLKNSEWYFYLDSIIEFNIKNYQYKKIKINNSLEFSSYIVTNNKKFLAIGRKGGEIYIYDLKRNIFEQIGKLNHNGNFIIQEYGNNQLLFLPTTNDDYTKLIYDAQKPFQNFNLNTFECSQLRITYNKIDFTSIPRFVTPTSIGDYIIFPNGVIFNGNNGKLFFPQKPNVIYLNRYNSVISGIGNNDYISMGCILGGCQSNYASIISINIKENERK